MAQTPEGKVKSKVSGLLKATPDLYYFMPVQGGYGAATLDYLGCYLGRFFAIETKAPGKEPTARQVQTIASLQRAGAKVFVIDGDISELKYWLEEVHGAKS
jgi:VRR-NUC domain